MLRPGSAVVTLPSDTEIAYRRDFDAPIDLVFTAFTSPEYVRQWWGFPGGRMLVCENDQRVGGKWRYVVEMDGQVLEWYGECLEMDPPRRLVSTETFAAFPQAMATNTAILAEADGVTTLSVVIRHQNKEFRDGHLNAGMEGGLQVSLDRMEAAMAAALAGVA
jgi:uncharacterized protein YndB with AHSA1/START domain